MRLLHNAAVCRLWLHPIAVAFHTESVFETRRLVAYALILLMIALLAFAEFKRREQKRKRREPNWRKRK